MSQTGRRSSQRQLSFPSQVCRLCSGEHNHISSPQQWTNEQACELVRSLGVSFQGLVCRPCRQDVTRVLGSSSYIPSEKRAGKLSAACISVTSMHLLIGQEGMNAALEEGDLKCVCDEIPCNSHPALQAHLSCNIQLASANPNKLLLMWYVSKAHALTTLPKST